MARRMRIVEVGPPIQSQFSCRNPMGEKLARYERTRTGRMLGAWGNKWARITDRRMEECGRTHAARVFPLATPFRVSPELHARRSEIEKEAIICLVFAIGKRRDVLPVRRPWRGVFG